MLHARDLIASAFVVPLSSRTRAVALLHEHSSFFASVLRQFEAPRRSVLSVQHAASERGALPPPHSRASARACCNIDADVCKRDLLPPRAHTASRHVLHRQLSAAAPSNAPGARAHRSTPAREGESVDENSTARLKATPDQVRSQSFNSLRLRTGTSDIVLQARHPGAGWWRQAHAASDRACLLRAVRVAGRAVCRPPSICSGC